MALAPMLILVVRPGLGVLNTFLMTSSLSKLIGCGRRPTRVRDPKAANSRMSLVISGGDVQEW